ncbi:MAG: hypothetical protein R3F59_13545 [Myxococcota bacterium]
MLLACIAAGALGAEPITWDNVTTEAVSAWDAGPGAGALAAADGAARAARAVPVGPRALRAEVQAGPPAQQQVLTAVEVPLGLGIRDRRWWTAQAVARGAAADAARWDWVLQVQDAWLAWWTASELAHHLDDYAHDVEDDLQGFATAVDEGLLAPLQLEDLRAESLQVRAEAAAMAQEAVVAEAEVRALLGERALDAGEHELHDVDPGVTNPWAGLADEAAALPAVREASARADAARRHAGALGASRTPTLEVGPMWLPDRQGTLQPLLFAGVRLPLQPGDGPARRDARARAGAAQADAAWQARAGAAALTTEALLWDAGRARLSRLQGEVLAPLASRQARLEEALAAGLVTADRVVRARRERHEAEHEQVLVSGALLASGARAEAVRRMLEEGR